MAATDSYGGNDDDERGGSSAAPKAMLQVLKRLRKADASAPLDPEQALVASLRGKMTLGDDDGEDDEEEGGGGSSSGDDLHDDLDDLEEEEEENAPLPLETFGITLSAETSRRLRELDREHTGSAEGPSEEAVFAALSEEERLAFFKAVAAKEEGEEGEEEEEEEPWHPWWQASESLNSSLNFSALSKDGTALVSEIGGRGVDDNGDDDDDSDDDGEKEVPPSPLSAPPPPPRSPLPRLASLLPARANGVPAPGVEATVVCALYGYCWAMRRCRGEWRKRRERRGGKKEGHSDDPGLACASLLLSETALIISGLSQPAQPGVSPPPLRAALSGCVERAANDVFGGVGETRFCRLQGLARHRRRFRRRLLLLPCGAPRRLPASQTFALSFLRGGRHACSRSRTCGGCCSKERRRRRRRALLLFL